MSPSSINKQADKLNQIIKKQNPTIYHLFSKKGLAIYFPKDGILTQSKEAKKTKINATIGTAFEENKSPMRLSSIANRVLLDPNEIFPYAPSFGKESLRKAWLIQIKKKNPSLRTQTSIPIVTSGTTHGLSIIGYLFLNKKDKIITTDKFWGNYRLIFELGFGVILDTYNTFDGNSFDISSFQKKLYSIRDRKIIILFNFPNNPTGYTPTINEAKRLASIIKKAASEGKRILVILDDAYFGLVYEKRIYKQSLFPLLANLHKNIFVIKLDAATKEDYGWGLRVGFVTFAMKNITKGTCRALEEKMAGVVRGGISNASHLSQSLILQSLESPTYKKEKRQKYQILKSRFEMVKKTLKNKKFSQYFSPLPFNSGYFMCIRLKKKLDGEKIRRLLIRKFGTGVIAMGNLIRIAYSSVAEKEIPSLFENIYSACKKQEKSK